MSRNGRIGRTENLPTKSDVCTRRLKGTGQNQLGQVSQLKNGSAKMVKSRRRHRPEEKTGGTPVPVEKRVASVMPTSLLMIPEALIKMIALVSIEGVHSMDTLRITEVWTNCPHPLFRRLLVLAKAFSLFGFNLFDAFRRR